MFIHSASIRIRRKRQAARSISACTRWRARRMSVPHVSPRRSRRTARGHRDDALDAGNAPGSFLGRAGDRRDHLRRRLLPSSAMTLTVEGHGQEDRGGQARGRQAPPRRHAREEEGPGPRSGGAGRSSGRDRNGLSRSPTTPRRSPPGRDRSEEDDLGFPSCDTPQGRRPLPSTARQTRETRRRRPGCGAGDGSLRALAHANPRALPNRPISTFPGRPQVHPDGSGEVHRVGGGITE